MLIRLHPPKLEDRDKDYTYSNGTLLLVSESETITRVPNKTLVSSQIHERLLHYRKDARLSTGRHLISMSILTRSLPVGMKLLRPLVKTHGTEKQLKL